MAVNCQQIVDGIPQAGGRMVGGPAKRDLAVGKDNAVGHHANSGDPGVVHVAD
jgi:hypothetical protein